MGLVPPAVWGEREAEQAWKASFAEVVRENQDAVVQVIAEVSAYERMYHGFKGPEQKKQYLLETRATLTEFLNLYPNSFCADRVKKNLEGLPSIE